MSVDLSVSIVIPTCDRNKDLLNCLNSLLRQTHKDFEVIIVNDGKVESVENIIKEFDFDIKLINQKKKGLVEARNLGWINSKRDIICFLDDDIIVYENWLEGIIKTFLISDNIAGVSGPTIVPEEIISKRDYLFFLDKFKNGNLFWRTLGKIYLNFFLEGKINSVGLILRSGIFTPGSNYRSSLEISNIIDVDYLEACHMCFLREIIKLVGGFDYSYSGTSEWSEPDLAFKIRNLGYRLVFNPKAVTEHRISKGGIYRARNYGYERSLNFINFYFKHIRPNTLDKFVRFYLYLIFLNLYWFYKFIESKDPNWLSGSWGILRGLIKYI